MGGEGRPLGRREAAPCVPWLPPFVSALRRHRMQVRTMMARATSQTRVAAPMPQYRTAHGDGAAGAAIRESYVLGAQACAGITACPKTSLSRWLPHTPVRDTAMPIAAPLPGWVLAGAGLGAGPRPLLAAAGAAAGAGPGAACCAPSNNLRMLHARRGGLPRGTLCFWVCGQVGFADNLQRGDAAARLPNPAHAR